MEPIVFVDLETTGATATHDCITEIGIVEVSEAGVSEWSTLVNPQTRISEFIERLTGISNAMVAGAPTFADVADDVLQRLHGRLFVAHNARFDYGFLKNAFKREGIDFRATVLCSVRLSRALYPGHARHSLDALIARHGLEVSARHRALGDARLIWQFMQQARRDLGPAVVEAAVAALTAQPALPPHLDPTLVDEIPEGHGVYLFYAENDLPLYIGKSKTLKKRVLAHFSGDHASAKEMSLSQQVRRIEWIETSGELGALLTEAELVKRLQPTHNRRLRRQTALSTWQLQRSAEGMPLRPKLVAVADVDVGRAEGLYGLFKSPRDAAKAMRALAEEHGLCQAVLGLDTGSWVRVGRPCFGYQIKTCRGACVGVEPALAHDARLVAALTPLKLVPWPYAGPVGIVEGEQLLLVDAWRHLGTVQRNDDASAIVTRADAARDVAFDADIYVLLKKHLARRGVRVQRLSALARASAMVPPAGGGD